MIRKILGITSVLAFFTAAGFAEDIRDVRSPVALPFNFFIIFVILILALIVAVFFLVRFFIKRRKSTQKEVVVPVRPPWEIAYEKLKKLFNDNLPAQGKVKEYYSRLSDIVRGYIEGRFEINAPDMTTEEFLSSAKLANKFSASQKELLKEFLSCCDMVKFAKYGSSESEAERSYAAAKRLVDETKEI